MKRLFSSWWFLTGLAALCVALLVGLALPIVWAPARPYLNRGLLIGAVVLVWIAAGVVRTLLARAAARRLEASLTPPTRGDEESALIAERLKSALGKLKTAGGNKSDYLYSRPWYVIIGPPGAGKTTALTNSGLRFPFSDTALKGVGGTRNLDFWFADEAVLVDTAGRYTTQDSDEETDKAAWTAFLGTLKKNRPLQPVNGVLVALGLDELLGADRARLDAHAAAVRRRLRELTDTLEVAPPVYVLFTKADLLAGFTEFYDDLDVEGRRAVLGATLDWPGGRADADRLAQEFDILVQAVADRDAKRLQDEMDARRRGMILGFPSQVAGLRSRVVRFLEGVFGTEGGQASAPLRGFYFTSGVQEGTPLDRLLGGMAQVYDAPPQRTPGQSGRAYFLNKLLTEVVIPEAGLVQTDPRAQRRRTAMLTGGFIGVGVLSLLLLGLFGTSFLGNRDLQTKLLTGSQNVTQEVQATGIDLVEVRESDPDLEQSLSVLRALRNLPRGYAERRAGGTPIMMGFGLFQRTHSREAEQAYLEGLQRIMLPRVLLRLERYLQDNQADPLALYEPLKVYLMLGGQGPALDRKAIKAWVERDWAEESLAGSDRTAVRRELSQHLDALLADPQFGRQWAEKRAPLDGALIDAARASVQRLSLADRAFAILKQKAAAEGNAGWRADAVLASGDVAAFVNGQQVLTQTVPYFFTKDGFQKAYALGLQTVSRDLERDLWVMGPDTDKEAIRTQIQGVRPGVTGLYAQEYIEAWDNVVKSMQPANYFGDAAAFGAFTRTPSPLKLMLLEVRKQTTFSGGVLGQAQKVADSKMQRSRVGKFMPQGGPATGLDAGKQIESYFKPLHDYVGDGKRPAALDEFVAAVKQAGSAGAAANVAGGGLAGASAQGQLATALGGVAAASANAPPQLQTFVAQAASSGRTAAVSSAQGAIADEYQRNLVAACRGVTENRYPFFGQSGNDATVTDLLRVFGISGQFDSFQRDRVGPLLETSGPVWRWRPDDPVAANLDPVSAGQLQKAAELRDLISSGLNVRVEATGFGAGVKAAEFAAGGAVQRFDSGAPGARPLQWSLSGGLPEARVVLYGADGKEARRFEAQGNWALFRLLDDAKKENAGETAIKATFGDGAQFVTFRIGLPSDKNPFSRGGLWSFRCPAKL